MLNDTFIKKVIYEVLSWLQTGTTETYITGYLENLPDSYPEEVLNITKTYIEARLIKYDEETVAKVCRIVQWVLPQYVYARLEGEADTADVVRKLEDKYDVIIKK